MTYNQLQTQSIAARRADGRWDSHIDGAVEQNCSQTWMISFADLMAILLTFMIVAYSTREIQPASWQSVSQSLQGVFDDDFPMEGTPSIGDRFESLHVIDDASIVTLVEELFPNAGEVNTVQLTPQGVEIDLKAIATNVDGLSDLAVVLTRMDRPLLVRVLTPQLSDGSTSIQRVLAWEKGLADAFARRSELMAEGLLQAPRISVSIAEGNHVGTMLVIGKHGRSDL